MMGFPSSLTRTLSARALRHGLALAAVFCTALLSPMPAAVEPAAAAPTARPPVAPPEWPARHLILLPGGGFTGHDPNFWPIMAPAAEAEGFVPHMLYYRTFDIRGAVEDARWFAGALIRQYGRANVFAFGSSAGGTLAALLASDGMVAAAVSSSGIYDLRSWPWAIENMGPEYLAEIGADWETRREYSPIRRRLRCPLMSMHGSLDPVVSVFQAEDYVARNERARLLLYSAGHGLYRSRPASIITGLRWLHRIGNKQVRIARAGLPRGSRAAEAARRIRCL